MEKSIEEKPKVDDLVINRLKSIVGKIRVDYMKNPASCFLVIEILACHLGLMAFFCRQLPLST